MTPGRPKKRSVRGDRGFALLAALWLVTTVSALAITALAQARVERRQSMNAAAELSARQAARAGVQDAITGLRMAASSAGLRETPRPLFWNDLDRYARELDSVPLFEGLSYRVTIMDAGSRLPLNDASEAELLRFFEALALPSAEARVLAASILDWRDVDDLHRGNGAEWPDHYSRLPQPVHPRNANFQSLDELAMVRGMTTDILRRCISLLTLDHARVNLNTAPEPVLRALPGLGEEAVRVLMERRRSGSFLPNLAELERELSAPARAELHRGVSALIGRITFEPSVLIVRSEGHAPGSTAGRSVIEATVSLSGGDVSIRRSLLW